MVIQAFEFPKFPSFLIVLILLFYFLETSESKSFLTRGSSLSPEDDSDLLTSADKTFTCGFYGLGENAYWFSIWFTYSKNRTVVWTANRDRPVNQGSRASLRRNGAMVLTDVDGTVIWITNTTDTSVNSAELLDSGNLVLKDTRGKVLWQSFDFPTDTLLPNQPFGKSTRLTSRLQTGSYTSGYFSLYFDSDNVLKMIYDGPEISSVYWPNRDFDAFGNGRTTFNSTRIAVLDDVGHFVSSDQFEFRSIDMGSGMRRRLTMDYDGNLRLYSLNNGTGLWMISWQALIGQCKAHGICGRYGLCVYTNSQQPKCTCPPGYEVSKPDNWNEGCKPKFNITCSSSLEQVKFVRVPGVDYYGFDLNASKSMSMDSCMKLCLNDCRCQAFSYRLTGEGRCYTKGVLYNGYNSPNFPGSIYLKLPVSVEASEPRILKAMDLMCQVNESNRVFGSPTMYDTSDKKTSVMYLYWFALAIGAIEALFIISGWWLLFRKPGMPSSMEDGYRAISRQFRRFSYSELKTATKHFKEELGRGASGAVYKGVLSDERVVAVKKLENFYQGEEVFWAEVSTVGKIYHMNLVRMWGFCSEGKHRLVVYEFVENQSLDKHLFSFDCLGWSQRFQVALGTAKGLAYLHHECLEWVIHCDVKPENILLDKEFDPKISDFGLAKLSQRDSNNSMFSRIRGTKGYMAPEWASNLPITAKVDVYSYGVVILEMVKGIRLSKRMLEESEEQEADLTRFVNELRRKILSGNEAWMEEIVDPRLNGNFSKNQVATLVEIGISCVDEDRNKRPTMDSVVQSLLECESESAVNPNDH